MRIVIDARFYGLEHAGLGRYTVNLLHELENIDSKNEYFILLRKKYFNKLTLRENFTKVLAEVSHYSVSEQVKLPKIINSLSADLVHFLHFNVPISYNQKFVVTIHDLLMHKSKGKETTTLPAFLYHFKRIGYKAVFNHSVKKAKSIIVPTEYVKEELTSHYGIDSSRVKAIYEGVDTKVLSSTSRKGALAKYGINDPYFIYTGNAYPHKNLKRAIEAVVALNQRSHQKVLFVIVSSRSIFTKRLEKVIQQEKAEEYIKLVGFVPDPELGVLYKNSLGYVYPSFSEGFGLPALEAMAAGTLALVSEIPVFKEVYGKQALYFNPYDFTSIEKTMNQVLTMDLTKRAKLVKESHEYTKKYSWEKMARETLKVYNSIYEKVRI